MISCNYIKIAVPDKADVVVAEAYTASATSFSMHLLFSDYQLSLLQKYAIITIYLFFPKGAM